METISLNARVHGKGRVPGQPAQTFDLRAFAHALEQHDIDYQIASYAADADVAVIDPDSPPSTPHTATGTTAVRAWLLECAKRRVDLRVTQLVDGGDRVAYTEQWHYRDGTKVRGVSTAGLQNGLITTQHTILVWDRDRDWDWD